MLPSMPILFASSRDCDEPVEETALGKDNNIEISNKTSKSLFIKHSMANEVHGLAFDTIPEDEKECDDELVLMAESSSLGEKRKPPTQTTPTRKKRKMEMTESIAEDRYSNDEQANHFATSYFMKAKAELDEFTFAKFIALLSEVEEEKVNITSLYSEMVELLSGHPDLIEEFIGFLHPHQALEVEKISNYFNFDQSSNFFRKLDAFHLNKVYHVLEQQLLNQSITSDSVKSSILSAFKLHPNIAEGLLSLLPDEKPPPSSKDDFEDISELALEDQQWERLSIPEKTGGGCNPASCDCMCHIVLPKKFCTFCNIKFSNGQIYVQTGKGLRFAKVTFRGCQQEEVLWRLNPTFYNKPLGRKRTKSLSHQSKETIQNSELLKSDDLTDKSKDGEKCSNKDTEKTEAVLNIEKEGPEELQSKPEEPIDPVISDFIEEVVVESSCENDSVTNQLQNSPVEQSVAVDEDTKKLEDKSEQDTIIESEGSFQLEPGEIKDDTEDTLEVETPNSKTKEEVREWTREEDKLILQAFQKQLGDEQTFSKISHLMPSRSINDIQGRFQVLMNLLEQMTSGCHASGGYPS